MYLIRELIYKTGLARFFSKRRISIIEKQLKINLIKYDNTTFQNILEVGCGKGKDLINFIKSNSVKITGIDIKDRGLRKDNFNLIISDAQSISFEDNYFDCTVSIGVIEHITPIDKLNGMINEINRVSRNYIIIVPSISTFIEPHTGSIL